MFNPLAEVSLFKKTDKVQLTSDFSLSDYSCKCDKCTHTLVCKNHLYKLQTIQDKYNITFTINSAFRCWAHNFKIGGEQNSMHLFGIATDIVCKELATQDLLKIVKPEFDGVGFYPNRGFVHIDSRGVKAYWEG